ncbi:MAG: glycosyltransferase [Cytophagaceae bacterium]|jgi:cellulose synthase/poly-beta-1,6-N-acetylglucosamine synthase-like glycosyltransferase|nr:glycosyltransferase [Cytophagaceae bacterium]
MEWLLGLVWLLYVVFLSVILFYLRKSAFMDEEDTTFPYIHCTVVVAFRNELKHLPDLFSDFEQLRYPDALVEFIWIDDHSEDQGADWLAAAIQDSPRHTLVRAEKCGKKNALAQGIAKAQGSWIVCTDADCRVSPEWLWQLNRAQQMQPKKLWSGRVSFTASSAWTQLLSYEFSTVIALGGACIRAGHPTMCNGANLAFERQSFEELGGYRSHEHIPSGDDEFLMHQMAQKYPGQVGFLDHPKHLVQSAAPSSLSEFIDQRLRWASKWQHYQNKASTVLALAVMLLQAGMLILFPAAILGWISAPFACALFLAKLLFDSVFIYKIREDFDGKLNLAILLILDLLYPIYVLYIGLVSRMKTYEWKGRRYS